MPLRKDRAFRSNSKVICIACGSEIPREKAREYDKHGDRWNRDDKEFEFLCKPCHRDSCHQPRLGLEQTLIEAGAGTTDDHCFLMRFDNIDSK
jgi:hypothetical protein